MTEKANYHYFFYFFSFKQLTDIQSSELSKENLKFHRIHWEFY